ncbi:hypothetical protein Zm00014a_030446 [Zea mays]|jgi:hypothetical protein|uniref:Uncharacterized protein n=3 Tax=Zea mays TaxID=4577 RepID=A0A8J8Y009_MAIZE|nr:uncharacterized protein LOC109941409 [Zea mays]AQK93545.1 hypothetical protein ZEAMMB73_Zm00001d010158 [Zea mays]PWZ12256.1 hypothetical protein Zm00014a_030446 [Zea mays]|eukprot:XP_020397928.1 uncharacterized protein LOC109941409 [Zea mays]
MADGLRHVMSWINDGLADRRPDLFTVYHCGCLHQFYQTVKEGGGFFKILMRPSSEFAGPGQPDVPLLFNFRDLYFVGFEVNQKFFLFKDAHDQLKDSRYLDPIYAGQWEWSGYSCSYSGGHWAAEISAYTLWLSYDCLVNFVKRRSAGENKSINLSIFRIITTIAEAKRFNRWLGLLLAYFESCDHSSSYKRKRKEYQGIFTVGETNSAIFQNWHRISTNVYGGESKFKACDGCDTYLMSLGVLAVLLGKARDDVRADAEKPEN